MEIFTLDRNFVKEYEIDIFRSIIWTDRYYGDGEVELIVPATKEMLQKLKIGTFLGLTGTNEVMILETHDINKGELKITGNSLLKFLNNRFIRTSSNHEDRYWTISGSAPGEVLWWIVYYMCYPGASEYPSGIPDPEKMKIPGLHLMSADEAGIAITVAVPFGPIYDALKQIATTYQVGMSLTLEEPVSPDMTYSIQFRSYRGANRTSRPTPTTRPIPALLAEQPVFGQREIVRFSPEMESFTDIKELQSIAGYKTEVYSFAPANPEGLAYSPGYDSVTGYETGFDLRALMIFAEDITTDMVGGDAGVLLSVLNQRASDALDDHKFIKHVDGEIVPTSQYKYGVHYNLGDLVEVEGYSGIIQNARVTEYIRAQDDRGERGYPTVTMIE